MKKRHRKKRIKTGVIAVSAVGIGTAAVFAAILLTAGGKEGLPKTGDIRAGEEESFDLQGDKAEDGKPAERESAEEEETAPKGEAVLSGEPDGTKEPALGEEASEKAEPIEEAGAKEQERASLLNIPVWTSAGSVNMRSGPDTESEVLTVLGRNAELVLKYEEDGWGAVSYEGREGYVNLDYLTREEPTTNGLVVVIDPGHQRKGDSTQEPNGPDSSTMKARVTGGTSGRTTGVMEYELTLDISLKLRDELEARGYTVYMTRDTHDINISNMERAQYATSVGADIAVRIHANGVENSSVSGALALAPSSKNPYISSLAGESQSLGKCILDAYCTATGMNNQGVISSDTMTGINWSTVPVTILEMGYMTNPEDDVNMEDASYQGKMVQGIADGVDDYFGF